MQKVMQNTISTLLDLSHALQSGAWRSEWGSSEIVMLSSAIVFFVIIVTWQLIAFARTNNKQMVGLGLRMMTAVVATCLWLVGSIIVSEWRQVVASPRAVRVERVNPVLVSVRWRSFDPTLSIALWGYSPQQLQEAAVGVGAQTRTKEHEVLISTEPNRVIYLGILTDGKLGQVTEGGI